MQISLKTGIIIFLSLILIGGLSYFGILPMYKNINKTNNEVISTQSQGQNLSQKLIYLKKIDDEKDTFAQYSLLAKKYIPDTPDMGNFLIEIESLLKKEGITDSNTIIPSFTGATDQSSSSSTPTTKLPSVLTDIQTHQYSITGTVSFPKILSLLNTLKNMSRLNEISAISIGTVQSKSDLNFTINGNVFSKPSSSKKQITSYKTLLNEAETYLQLHPAYSKPIDIKTESGFGRPNPFAGY